MNKEKIPQYFFWFHKFQVSTFCHHPRRWRSNIRRSTFFIGMVWLVLNLEPDYSVLFDMTWLFQRKDLTSPPKSWQTFHDDYIWLFLFVIVWFFLYKRRYALYTVYRMQEFDISERQKVLNSITILEVDSFHFRFGQEFWKVRRT